MSAGLFALFDDVATLAKLAAASVDDVGAAAGRASVKAAGVVVDDTAVTPQYVHGVNADREIPIIKKIARGSLKNKLLIILPAAMLLSQFLPWLLTPILMAGGAFLCYEGAEKVWEKVSGHGGHDTLVVEQGEDMEKKLIAGAIRTDLILSAEIMVIALGEVADQPFVARLAILIVVAFAITILVYGVVALIVKMDDVGLSLAGRNSKALQKIGRGLVAAMPKLLGVISAVGTAAMLWVGGHIFLNGLNVILTGDEHEYVPPYSWVHHLEEEAHHLASGGFGELLGWLANTAGSAVGGLLLGGIIVAVMHFLPFGHSSEKAEAAH